MRKSRLLILASIAAISFASIASAQVVSPNFWKLTNNAFIIPLNANWTMGSSTVALSAATTTFNGVAYTWPAADGSSLQVLSTDGSGQLSWVTSAGGGGGASTMWLVNGFNAYASTTFEAWNIGGTASSTADIVWGSTGYAVFNEQSNDVDFRVESNGNANMLFVDGGADRVGVGTNIPSSTLHVVGTLQATGNTTLGGTLNTHTIPGGTGTFALTSDLHNAVTLAGEDYLTLSTQQITAVAIDPDNLSASDFGDFTCNGTTCTLDATYLTAAITSLNGLTGASQTFATTTSSGVFTIASTGTTHTLTLPSNVGFFSNDANYLTSVNLASDVSGILPIANGGTATSSIAANNGVFVSNGTTWQNAVLPSCSDATGSKLLYNNTTRVFSCGTDQSGGGGGSVSTTTPITTFTFPFWQTDTGGLNGSSSIFYSAGSIGIGHAVPSSTLHIVGTLQATATSSLASATFSGMVRASSTLEVTGVSTLAGGLTLGGNLIFAGDTIDELVGTGLQITSGDLETTLGTAVDLASEVTGDLPFANLTQGSALSVLGVSGNATADVASISAAADHRVLRRSGTNLSFGAVRLDQAAAVTNVLGIANGGTGTSTIPADETFLIGDGTSYVFATLTNCSDATTGKLLYTSSTNTFSCGTDQNSGSATAWDAINDPSGAGAIAMAETVQTLDWNTNAVAAVAADYFTLTSTNDAAADVDTQRLFVLDHLGGSTAGLEVMQRITNSDASTITTGLLIDGGVFTTAIDVSDSDIGTALSIGANDILTSGATISSTELNRLDGITGAIYFAGGTDVAIADGGTATSTTPAALKVLVGNGTNYDLLTLTAGSGITVSTSTTALTVAAVEKCSNPLWTIENPSATEDDQVWIANVTSTITKVKTINKNAGSSATFNLVFDASRATASASAKKVFTSNVSSTATTTIQTHTITGSSTIGTGEIMRFITSAASSSQFSFQHCYTEN